MVWVHSHLIMTTHSNANRSETVTVQPDDAGERLDRLLARALTGLSRSRVKGLIEAGRVGSAGQTISDPSMRVKSGQTFAIFVPEPEPAAPQAQAIDLAIVYEDADLIVIDKPAGMVVHPAPGNPDATLVNALIGHCGASLSGIGGVRRPGIVHRLDKDTSGLIVVAKTDAAHAGLARQFADHSVDRAYRAVVWGVPRQAQGEIAGNIGRSPANRKKMAVLSRGGRTALTRYRVIRRFGSLAGLIECRLATGRTHQIRVHMASLGHPVVGDPVYGRRRRSTPNPGTTSAARTALEAFPRQALHAFRLGFVHPGHGNIVTYESEIPNDINRLIRELDNI
jgi:23S rRNA pseudouridine1911/1915/1917 synthase